MQVILGGGRQNFIPTTEKDPEYYNSPGHRTDGRNLIKVSHEWHKVNLMKVRGHGQHLAMSL